jgi:predicted nuclease of predicted toxin-antitoxin system
VFEPKLQYLADMNVSPKTVGVFQRLGVDMIRTSSLLPETASDETILDLARKTGRVLITQDLDFSALLAIHGYDRPSLITLRLSQSDPNTVTDRLSEVIPKIEGALAEGCAVTVEDRVIRIRPIPIR